MGPHGSASESSPDSILFHTRGGLVCFGTNLSQSWDIWASPQAPPWVLPWAGCTHPRKGKCHPAGCENTRSGDPPKSLSTVSSPGPSCLLAQGANISLTVLLTSALPFISFYASDSVKMLILFLRTSQPLSSGKKKNIYIYIYIYIYFHWFQMMLYTLISSLKKQRNKTHKPDPRLYNSIWCIEMKDPSRRNFLL